MLVKYYKYFLIITTFIALICLFIVKDQANKLDYHLTEVNRQIINEQDTIQVLKAELAWLRSPERIRTLAMQYLKLENVSLKQIIPQIPQVQIDPNNISKPEKSQALASKSIKVNWRYKTKGFHTASHKK